MTTALLGHTPQLRGRTRAVGAILDAAAVPGVFAVAPDRRPVLRAIAATVAQVAAPYAAGSFLSADSRPLDDAATVAEALEAIERLDRDQAETTAATFLTEVLGCVLGHDRLAWAASEIAERLWAQHDTVGATVHDDASVSLLAARLDSWAAREGEVGE